MSHEINEYKLTECSECLGQYPALYTQIVDGERLCDDCAKDKGGENDDVSTSKG